MPSKPQPNEGPPLSSSHAVMFQRPFAALYRRHRRLHGSSVGNIKAILIRGGAHRRGTRAPATAWSYPSPSQEHGNAIGGGKSFGRCEPLGLYDSYAPEITSPPGDRLVHVSNAARRPWLKGAQEIECPAARCP